MRTGQTALKLTSSYIGGTLLKSMSMSKPCFALESMHNRYSKGNVLCLLKQCTHIQNYGQFNCIRTHDILFTVLTTGLSFYHCMILSQVPHSPPPPPLAPPTTFTMVKGKHKRGGTEMKTGPNTYSTLSKGNFGKGSKLPMLFFANLSTLRLVRLAKATAGKRVSLLLSKYLQIKQTI